MAKNEETNIRRQLQARLQELEITSSTSSTIHSELKEAVETYKTKTDSYLQRLEEAEIAKAKALRAEAFGKLYNSGPLCRVLINAAKLVEHWRTRRRLKRKPLPIARPQRNV